MSSEQPRFDPNMLRSFVGDSPAALKELLDLYISSCTTTLQRMLDAASRGDSHEVFVAAHRLKTSSYNVGALELSRISSELEALAEGGADTDSLASLVERCRVESMATLEWVASLGERG